MQAKKEMQAIKDLNEKIAGIVESGSNDNGSWVKYADGTMKQWGSASFIGAETGNTGSYKVITFPQVFANNKISVNYTPLYVGSVSANLNLFTVLTGTIKYGEGSRFTGDTVYRRLSYTTDTTELAELYATNLPFNWEAIGKWK